jgi:hypothetical protein
MKVNVTVEKSIEIPNGYRFVKYDYPKNGDNYLDGNGYVEVWYNYGCKWGINKKLPIIDKIQPEKRDLIGLLCGVSYNDVDNAREVACNGSQMYIIKDYDESIGRYKVHGFVGEYPYAYPVSTALLKELLEKAEKVLDK